MMFLLVGLMITGTKLCTYPSKTQNLLIDTIILSTNHLSENLLAAGNNNLYKSIDGVEKHQP
jgi:hypothetical protein